MNKLCKTILYFFFSFIFPLFFVFFSNVYIDSGNVFHDNTDWLAAKIVEGNDVYITSNNVNYRKLKCRIIEKMPKHVDTVVVGSSETMWLNNSIFGDNFYNLGVNIANFYSYIGIIGALFYNDVHFNKIVIHIRPEFFYDELISYDGMYGYTEYGQQVLKQNTKSVKFSNQKKIFNIGDFVSLSYFQDNIIYLIKNIKKIISYGRYGIYSEQKLSFIHNDASLDEYDKHKNEVEVIKNAEKLSKDLYPDKCLDLSLEKKQFFEDLMMYFKANNIVVVFILPPISPALWKNLKDTNKNTFERLEKYITKYAKINNIDCLGSFNPGAFNITDADFYDSRHMRRESLSVLFN